MSAAWLQPKAQAGCGEEESVADGRLRRADHRLAGLADPVPVDARRPRSRTPASVFADPPQSGRTRGCGATTRKAFAKLPFALYTWNTVQDHRDIACSGRCCRARWWRSGSRRMRFPGQERALRRAAFDDDAARAGHDDPGLQDIRRRSGWYDTFLPLTVPVVLRRGVLHLPAAAVLHDDPARDGRGRAHRRREHVAGLLARCCCRR